MRKLTKSMGITLLSTAAMALTGCFGAKDDADPNGKVQFWSSFGATYSGALDTIVSKISANTGLEIQHDHQGSYPEIRRNMISAIAVGDYPNIATGYPDHFVSYLAADILTPLDDLLTAAEKNDYYADYLTENIFYDNSGSGTQRLYGVPFNKSTELLGYNGVFVDYCATQESSLATIPATWQEWEVKGPAYKAILDVLVAGKNKVYGKQQADGTAYEFEVGSKTSSVPAGKKLLLDFSNADPNTTYLMSWDSTDNAFITLTRQWGAEYTNLPDTEAQKPANRRKGKVMFTSTENKAKVVKFLEFFHNMYENKLFATPGHLGSSYASGPFENCKVMFMICSSGGLSYNTTNWAHRFRVAPIPYYDDGASVGKYVISQGANLCLTNKAGGRDSAVQVLKKLSSSEFQTEWCLETGYFPSSQSVANSSAYQAFLNGTSYDSATAVAFREGAKVNSNVYLKASEAWNKFVDPAFVGSAILRETLATYIKKACDLKDPTPAKYGSIVDDIKNDNELKSLNTIEFM
jgi:multiple sugar transport system substrate-binding protein